MTQMAREIADQPAVLKASLERLIPQRAEIVARFAGRRNVLFFARGSSNNAATYGRYLLEGYAGIRAATAAPSIATHYRSPLDLSDSVVVSVSQSGQTTEIIESQEWARSRGAVVIAVSNDPNSPLAQQSDLALITQAGTEFAVPATKSYLTQLAALAVLASAFGPRDDRFVDDLRELPYLVAEVLAVDPMAYDPVIEQLAGGPVIVTGRGLLLGTALEAALKLEETCTRPVRSYSYADLRHGPISVVEEGLTAVLFGAADGPFVAPMVDLAADLRSRGATTVSVGGEAGLSIATDYAIGAPNVSEKIAPLVSIVPMQVVVERLSRRLGLDPDAPRGLCKVTSSDVLPLTVT